MPERNANIISEAIRYGNHEFFEAFYMAEFTNVVFFIDRYLNDSFAAQDLAQDTFISLWNTRERIDPQYNIRTYTFTIAKNKSLNYLRDNTRKRVSDLAQREAALNAAALESLSLRELIEAMELESLIEKIYELMPEKYKDTFILSRKFGMTYEEIARKKGVSVKVVEYHVSLGLSYFRNKLKGYTGLWVIAIAALLLPGTIF